MKTETLLFGLTLLFYLLGSLCYHVHLFVGSGRARRGATVLIAAGLATHTAALGVWCLTHESSILGEMPLSLVAFLLALVQLAVDLRRGWASLGSLVVPLAFMAQLYASVRALGAGGETAANSAFLRSHVLVLLLGFAAFALAFCLAVIYLVQSRLLKTKQVRGIFKRLPPLESVGTGAHWLAAVGFSLLTLGMVAGAIVAPQGWDQDWYLDQHILTGVVAWVIYAAYLVASLLLGWRGRRTTYFLIAGFLVVLVAFFASVRRPVAEHTTRPTAAARRMQWTRKPGPGTRDPRLGTLDSGLWTLGFRPWTSPRRPS
jgi:ABC-type uncharacterized transport system permease subunit